MALDVLKCLTLEFALTLLLGCSDNKLLNIVSFLARLLQAESV
jgi:hypothetical protein